jgi:stage III sporulation protein AG
MEQKMTSNPENKKTNKKIGLKDLSLKNIGIILLGLIAVWLIINGNPFYSIATNTRVIAEVASNESLNVKELEQRLATVLAGIDGVGEVSVMLTLDSGKEIVPVLEKEATGETNISVKPVIVSSGTGSEPVVLKELEPVIRGVIVVAEGADDIGVRYNLELAVMTVLGIDEHRVEIFNME